jgi:peptidoglycan/LPS O-acetylase OafA/YrhL
MNLTPTRSQMPALTSLRFLAAVWVAIFHAQAMRTFFGPEWFQQIAVIGYMGVSFFFVLSGFILVYTYSDRLMNLREFWQSRFARIYPAFIFSLLLTGPGFFYVCLKMDVAKIVPEWVWPAAHLKISAITTLFLVQTWIPQNSMAWHMPVWSLSNEAFFYLLFPFLLPLFGRFSSKQLMTILPVGFVFGLTVTALYHGINPDGALALNPHVIAPWQYFIKFNPILRLPEFLMGMACGHLFLRNRNGNGGNRQWAWPLLLGGIAMIAVGATVLHRNPTLIFHASVVAPAFAAIVYGVALRPAGLGILDKRFFVLLGDASYSFYLLHSMVIAAFTRFFVDAAGNLHHQNPLWFLLPIATIALISIGVYKGIERPMRRVLGPKRKGNDKEKEKIQGVPEQMSPSLS